MPDGLSDDEIFVSYVETFSAFAERNGMEFSAYMEYLLENGTYFYKGSKESMRIDDLRENIDFVVYAVGIDLEANRLSEVVRLPFILLQM